MLLKPIDCRWRGLLRGRSRYKRRSGRLLMITIFFCCEKAALHDEGFSAQNQPEQRPYRWESTLAREDCRHEKSRIAPIAVVNKTIPGPPSGTLWRRTAVGGTADGTCCACARRGKITAAPTRAQTLPMRLLNRGMSMLTTIGIIWPKLKDRHEIDLPFLIDFMAMLKSPSVCHHHLCERPGFGITWPFYFSTPQAPDPIDPTTSLRSSDRRRFQAGTLPGWPCVTAREEAGFEGKVDYPGLSRFE